MFRSRLISSIILLIVFLSAFLLKGYFGLLVFLVIGTILSILCVRELSSALKNIGYCSFANVTEIFAAIVFIGIILTEIYSINFNVVLLVGGMFGIYCWIKVLLSKNNKESLIMAITSSSVFILTVIPLNCLTLIYMKGYFESYVGVNLVLLLILVTKFGDIGAYSVGTLMSKRDSGNHKIVPSISPKKSWEGTIGGAIISIIITFIITSCLNYGISFSWYLVCLLGLLLFVGGFIGDLSESAFKRITGIKDSGAVIPGIGGALDLVDSLLLNAPLFYLFLVIFHKELLM
jgi:phosphatidate cytidylyltransferase